MTPTTDLQKVDAAGLLEGVKIANKARHQFAKIDREVARMHLANAAPDLAARVIELEAENKRMREGLAFYANPDAWNQPPIKTRNGLISVEYENEASQLQKDRGNVARAALKGGEI